MDVLGIKKEKINKNEIIFDNRFLIFTFWNTNL